MDLRITSYLLGFYAVLELFAIANAKFNCLKNAIAISYNCEKDSPSDGGCDFDTEYAVRCEVTCQERQDKEIWGTVDYTYDSSLCRSALHDLRISSWNTSERTVRFVRKNVDPREYHNTIRQGVESVRYGRIAWNNGIFYFTSPRIKEPLVDITSLHRLFLFNLNQNSIQECHLPAGHTDNRAITFSYYIPTLEDGTPRPTAEVIRAANHVYYRGIWGLGLKNENYKKEVRKSIPGGVICRLEKNDLSVITSMTMRSDAHFKPPQLTITGNVGEPITLIMKLVGDCSNKYYGLTWRKDNKELDIFQDFDIKNEGFKYMLEYKKLKEGHAGVYSLECDQYQKKIVGQRYDRRGVVRLIVRSCPANLFGDDCNVSCPECQNGGICHDILGVCICPPGFKGSNCETPCGPNTFGADCSKKCSDTDPSGSETCTGVLFCLPDPYGCSCATGFKGIDCKSNCEAGSFGAGCTQTRECHCADKKSCDIYTGLCPHGCDEGWKDSACITSYPFLPNEPKLLSAKPMRLDLTFQAWDGNSGKGNPATYIVEMKDNATVGDYHKVAEFDATALTYPDFKNVSIEKLTPNTMYAIRVVIVDLDDQSQKEMAPVALYRTACGRPKAKPYDLKVTSPNSKSVILTWKNPDPSTFQCSSITLVVVHNSTQGSFEEKTNKETLTFISKPFTTWTIAVKIVTENDRSSDWAYFEPITTAEDAPEVPKELKVNFDNETKSILVNWKKPLESNGILRAYRVKLAHSNWQHNCMEPVRQISFNVSDKDTSVVFNETDFRYSSLYQVYVSAITIKEGPEVMRQIVTPESIPIAAPKNLQVTSIERRGCVLRWEFPDCVYENGYIVQFNITIKGLDEWASKTLDSRSSRITSAQLSNLIPFTNYEVRIVACTSMGCGEEFVNETFTTNAARPGPPKDLTVYITTQNSISITWLPPSPPLSYITKYRILYQKKSPPRSSKTDHTTLNVNELSCKDSEVRIHQLCYTIEYLDPLTIYDVWVTAIDDEGRESDQIAHVSPKTQTSIPEAPKNVELENRTTNSLFISWLEPVKANGELIRYRINATLTNLHGLKPIDGERVYSIVLNGDEKSVNISELEPASTYNVSVEASTLAGYGPPIFKEFYTKTQVPKVNIQPEVGKITKDSVQLLIKPITDYKGPISAYFVLVKDVTKKRRKRAALEFHTYNESRIEYVAGKLKSSELPEEGVLFTVGDGEIYDEFYNGPLQNEHKYIFGMAVRSEVDGEQQIGFLYLDNEIYVSEKSNVTPQAGIIIGTILAVILIFGVFFLILYYKKPELFYAIKDTGTNSFLMKNSKSGLVKDSGGGSTNSVADMDLYDDCLVRNSIKSNRIHVKDLEAYVQEANISSNIRQEYVAIGKGLLHPCKVGKMAENKSKNRYPSLLPYDHSRVKLAKIEGDNYSDYINANYIENYKGEPKFIASQGPKPLTVVDFWRMVWQENCCKIVMVTNLIETAKTKSEKYWPDKVEKYGPFTVTLVETATFANYVIRKMTVSKDDDPYQWEVKQFHFTTWPDHGIPYYPVTVTTFLKQIRNYQEGSTSPILVHCSAGIGRTGTFILLANMIEMAKETNTVDVQHGLWSMRQCRVNLVETLEQYIFVYRALVDHLFSGETSLLCPEFIKTYDEIISSKNGSPSVAQNQFDRLKRLCPLPVFTDCTVAHEPVNGNKNRIADILPTDRARAILPVKEAGQNDYINAVYINGYKQNNAFIATQLPLPDTINDFWRLVYSTKIRSIVLLHEFNPNDSTCPQYWEDGATQTYGTVEVNHVSSESQGTVVIRTFNIKDVNLKSQDLTIKQFHLQGWVSTKDTPDTPDCILELIDKAERWQRNTGARALLVQCLNGCSGCGILCTSAIICEKIKHENEVDIYLSVRESRANRPQFITNLNQYIFLHKVAMMYLDSFETYANFQ